MILFKNNRIDARFEMPNIEIAEKFMKSEFAAIEDWPLRRQLRAFISYAEGLCSTFEDGEQWERDIMEIEKHIVDKTYAKIRDAHTQRTGGT